PQQRLGERPVIVIAPDAGQLEPQRKNQAPDEHGGDHAQVTRRGTFAKKELNEFAPRSVTAANDDRLEDKPRQQIRLVGGGPFGAHRFPSVVACATLRQSLGTRSLPRWLP